MQGVFGAVGAAAGCGQPQPQRPHINKFIRTGSSAMPQSTEKKLMRCGIPRLLRTVLREALAQRQILVRSKFAFLLKLSTNQKSIQRTLPYRIGKCALTVRNPAKRENTQNQTMSGGGRTI